MEHRFAHEYLDLFMDLFNSHLNLSLHQYREFIAMLTATQRATEQWISGNVQVRFLSQDPDSLRTIHSTLGRAVAGAIHSGELG